MWRLIALGCAAGVFSGMFGVGGGLVLVPGLAALGGLDTKRAHATCLIAVVPIGIIGTIAYAAHGAVSFTAAALIAIGATVGALVGPRLLAWAPTGPLRIGFLIALTAIAVQLIGEFHASPQLRVVTAATVGILIASGFVVGSVTTVLGIGGGTVLVPLLVTAYSLGPAAAKGTSLAVVVVVAVVGSAGHLRTQHAELRTGAIVGAAGAVTALISALLSVRVPDATFRWLLLALIVLALVSTIRDGLADRRRLAVQT